MELDVRHVLDSLGEPLLAMDPSARIVHANMALKELLGWSRLELLGRPVSLVIPEGLPGLPLNDPRQPLRVRALRRDGQSREVEVRLSPWRGGGMEGLLLVSIHALDAQVELERQLRLHRRLDLLDAALGQALARAMDDETAAYAALRACGEAEGWALGTYWVVDVEHDVLRPLTVWTATTALGGFVEETLRRAFSPGEGMPGRAWSHREPVWVRDVAVEPHFARAEEASHHGLHGAIFVPVPSGGRLQGVLELFRNEPLAEREEEEALASALGHQLGRFFERLRNERTEHMRDTVLRTLWNADLLGLFMSDAQGRLLDANPTLLRMLGYTRQDLGEGRLTWARLLPAAWRATSEGALRRLREDGTYHSFEGELLRKNDSGLPVLLGSTSLGEGNVVTFALDLSDWRSAESSPHQEANSRLHTLITHAPVVLFALDGDGTFTLSEGRGLEALRLKPGQVVGMSVFDVYRSEPAILAHVRRALAGEDFIAVEALTNGRVYETHWTPLRDPEGDLAGTLGLAVDVTQRELEERWRARLLEEAEEARTAAELAVRVRDDFLSIASHELKTPLTALHLQLQTLLKRAREGHRSEEAQRLEKAQRQALKLARMMEELLDVSWVTSGRPRLELDDVDLTQLVQEVMDRFQDEARRTGTRLELRGSDAVVGRWDRARLEQVVTNLVSNALKYGSGSPVEVSVRSSGLLALLEVTDHGIGIAPENLERIFGKFERAVSVRKYGGFGLGLYIVRQLVEALGGAVDVESTPGKGATFRVVLPLAGPELQPTPPSATGLH